MKRALSRFAVAAGLVFAGWTVGRSQPASPDFELIVEAPGGETTIQCVKGCKLAWVERGVNPNSQPTASSSYACTGSRCLSGRLGGWRD
jgi:hypothetical protein